MQRSRGKRRSEDRLPPLTVRSRDWFESPDHPSDSGDLPVTENCTLSEVFEWAFRPIWIEPLQLDSKTVAEYETTLRLWQRLSPAESDQAEPQLWELQESRGDRIGGRFLTRLAQEPGCKRGTVMAIGTIRKHVRNVNKLLGFCGPRLRTRHGLKNLGVIEQPILLVAPSADDNPPEGDWTIDEVRAMWTAAATMRSAALRALGVTASQWWEAILTVAAHTGLRRGQLLGLSYADLDPPHVLIRPSRSKKRRGRKQYLSREALVAIERIRTGRQLIFVWPHFMRSRKHPDRAVRVNVRYLDLQLRLLAKRAGLPPARWFGWNGFRKLAASEAFAIGGEQASQALLGHAKGSRVAMKHYVSGHAQAKHAAAVIDQMPSAQPASADDRRQQKLF